MSVVKQTATGEDSYWYSRFKGQGKGKMKMPHWDSLVNPISHWEFIYFSLADSLCSFSVRHITKVSQQLYSDMDQYSCSVMIWIWPNREKGRGLEQSNQAKWSDEFVCCAEKVLLLFFHLSLQTPVSQNSFKLSFPLCAPSSGPVPESVPGLVPGDQRLPLVPVCVSPCCRCHFLAMYHMREWYGGRMRKKSKG